MKQVDIWHIENAAATLERANALVAMLRETTETAARDNSAYKTTFDRLTLNLWNLFEILDSEKSHFDALIESAYQPAETA